MKRVKKYYNCFKRLLPFMGSKKKTYIIGCIMNTANIAVSFLIPFILSYFILIVQNKLSGDQLIKVIILCIILLFSIPLASVGNYLKRVASIHGTSKLRKDMYHRIQNISIKKLDDLLMESYITRITNDVENINRMLQGFGMVNLFRFFVLYVPAFLILIIKDWRMALIGVVLNIISIITSTFLNPKVRFYERTAQAHLENSAGVLIDAVRGASLIRVFAMQNILQEKYSNSCKAIYRNRTKYIRLNGLVSSITFILYNSSKLIGSLFGIYLMFEGKMELSQVVLTSGLIGIMADGLNSMTNFIKFVQNGLVSSERVFEILETPLEYSRRTQELLCLSHPEAIVFKDVSFSYNNHKQILNSLSFTVKKGEVLAIAGPSGSGKSTIAKLLQSLYEIESGEILLFGVPYSKLSNEDIRKQIAYVSQDNMLFQGTIKDNISFGRIGSTFEEVIEACKSANIHDFIMSLPQGYDTIIDEDSKNISGGQKQRLAIARAFLKNAPILILDEPTSALDLESEEAVFKAIDALLKGRTAIIITHKKSAINLADKVLILDK